MRLHELSASVGSRKTRKRIGRGHGSGQGKTAGKGHKGQNARSGGGVRPGFEGGQLPLFKRLPKRGFTNINHKEYAIVNLATLNRFKDGDEVSAETLLTAGIIKNVQSGVKILGNGQLERKLTVKVAKASTQAIKQIEALGGQIEVV